MFQIIGERINTSREGVQAAVAAGDGDYIREEVRKQLAAGAHFIDVNGGARIGHEREDTEWLLEIIVPLSTVPLCLDSPDPAILEMAYGMVDKDPLINSISLEKERLATLLPFLRGKRCAVVALCLDDSGLPNSSSEILERAEILIGELESVGLAQSAIYIDPVVQPISTDVNKGIMVLEAVHQIKKLWPNVHVTGGLSNVSYGLPERQIVNRTFLTLMMGAGLDSAIFDPLDEKLMAVLHSAEMLLGKDPFCKDFLRGVRGGEIVS